MSRRLSIIITEADQCRMRNVIPWGLISRIMRMLLLQTLDLVERHGDVVLGALLSGQLTALDLIKKEVDTHGSSRLKDDSFKPE
jgi:hypothetical protein